MDIGLISTWMAPPVIGAFIGYLTNRIAIRMLFRPLRPWHLLGIRIPMTPGVIPAKRHLLAANIGEMVGRHLLTPMDIGAALSEERFQEQLQAIIVQGLRETVARELGPPISLVPERFQSHARIGLRSLRHQVQQGVRGYLESDAFAEAFAAVFQAQVEELAGRSLNEVLPLETRRQLYSYLDLLLAKLAASPGTEEQLARTIHGWLLDSAAAEKRLADVVPGSWQELIGELIHEQVPSLLARLGDLLAEEPVRRRLIAAICRAVDHFIDGLGPLGAMARGFIDPAVLEEKIGAYLDEKQEELAGWIGQKPVRERIVAVLGERLEEFFQTSMADLLARVGSERLERLCSVAAAHLLEPLQAESVRKKMVDLFAGFVEEVTADGTLRLEEVATLLSAGERSPVMLPLIQSRLLELLRSDRVYGLLDRLVRNLLDDLTLRRPLGKLERVVPEPLLQAGSDYLLMTANRILLKEVPDLVDSLNIRRIVTEKVDSLDLLRLENLLLSIMEEQFKYINLFGALLGFLIGLLNLLVLRLG